ncbi:3-dehydroquinate synthase [Actinomyces viscosus]|uniref:Multifunctional fusion protein n=1 Tax=Actinomyces viscosus TaxID=1656 RepID=A0A3S4WIM6_ACTVI|nr:3-dehydroquinate synthase [Actinomyces viscosus]TFH53983.1 3-dehydroquinate synthase [Actinomyces viscosus]VEI14866.1 3-dehydroquinate synthase [Actinomyces viscosus]
MTWKHVPTIALRDDQLPLVLVGLPGAGKTTQARLLAQALGVQVTDTDAEIRRRARMTIPEIFASEGEEGFRDREHRAMRAVLDSPAAAQGVIALGGGAVLRPENRELLRGHTVIHLSASPSTAARHVGDGTGRPLMTPDADSDQTRAAQRRSEHLAENRSDKQGEYDGVLARMEALHAQRSPLYSEVATLTVPTDGLTPQQVAALILVALGVQTSQAVGVLAPMAETQTDSPAAPDGADASPRRVRVRPVATTEASSGARRVTVGGPSPYDVLIGHGLLADLAHVVRDAPGAGAGGVAIIHAKALSERATGAEQQLASQGLRVLRIEVPDGEAAKKARVLEYLWERLGSFRLGRDGLVIGLGGGATTDLAGFAAATWLRGVPVVQVPTTLLAMVDAAVGGKTGIDTPAGKNLVGAFHPPAAVIADLETLSTLPTAELRAGLGEVIKCGLIADPVILDRVLAEPADCLAWDSPVLADLVARSIAVKAAVVGEDLTEAGLREILNYGHTYAHAIEKVTGYSWRHGEAVAVGCVFAAEVAHRCGKLSSDALALHRQSLKAVGLPVSFPEGHGRWDELKAVMMSDKKVRGGRLRLVLLDDVARPVRVQAPGEDVLIQAHEAVTGQAG